MALGKIRIKRNKNFVEVPEVECITAMRAKVGKNQLCIWQIPMTELLTKRKRAGVDIKGFPLYFALSAGVHTVQLFPTPNINAEVEIEYEPLRRTRGNNPSR